MLDYCLFVDCWTGNVCYTSFSIKDTITQLQFISMENPENFKKPLKVTFAGICLGYQTYFLYDKAVLIT